MFGNLSSTISSVFGTDFNIDSVMSKFGGLSVNQNAFLQSITETLPKVDFPELKEAIMKGDFKEVLTVVQNSKDINPEFHQLFSESHSGILDKIVGDSQSTQNNDSNNLEQPITTHHAEPNVDLMQSEDPNDGSVFAEMANTEDLADDATYNENKS